MKAPSFFIAQETETGITMEYRSKRRGFQFYVQGQIKELSKNFAQELNFEFRESNKILRKLWPILNCGKMNVISQ